MRIILFMMIVTFASCSGLKKTTEPQFDKVLSTYQYPFEVKYFDFTSQNQKLRMAYMDLNSGAKKAAVLLHGKNFSGFYWKRVASDLVDKGYRVIIPDQIGFGKSTKPSSYQYSFYNLALNTHKLLASLGATSFTLVGHSMGGMLATHFTYLYPKSVSKLIMINPIGLEPYLKFVEYKDPEFFYKMELGKTPEKFKAYQKKNYYDGNWNPAYDELLIPLQGQMRGPEWKIVAWNNALTYGPIFSEDITTKLPHIKNKVVLIIGTRDKTGPGRGWKKKGITKKLGQYEML